MWPTSAALRKRGKFGGCTISIITICMISHYSFTLRVTGRGLQLFQSEVCQPAYNNVEVSRGQFLLPVLYTTNTYLLNWNHIRSHNCKIMTSEWYPNWSLTPFLLENLECFPFLDLEFKFFGNIPWARIAKTRLDSCFWFIKQIYMSTRYWGAFTPADACNVQIINCQNSLVVIG